MNKLSIIIPCYNAEATLDEAVASCFRQNVEIPYEIVLVDDASTDTTRAKIELLAETHENIVIAFHEKNFGGGATRNTAVQASDGDAIFCLDADDILPDGTLGKMLACMKKYHADGIGLHNSTKFKGKDIHNIDVIHTFDYVNEKIPLESLLQKNNILCPLYSVFMFTRNAFVKAGGYPENHGFDTQGFAWRFLSAGLIAYTCPDTNYFHRVAFHDSYYLREDKAGKVNYNWQDILLEHLPLFTGETKEFIVNFNVQDFSKNLFDELRKRDHIFRSDVQKFLGKKVDAMIISRHTPVNKRSMKGIFIRLKAKLKKQPHVRNIGIYIVGLYKRIYSLISEGEDKRWHYEEIARIKEQKEIVVQLESGGIGDCLIWTTLPRLLKETYGIDFYLSKKSLDIIRQRDAFKLCFELNPYFRGSKESGHVFTFKRFESEKSFYSFVTDKGGENIIETLERQFDVHGKGKPELHYMPKTIPEYEHIILIDKNTISGQRFGWKFKENSFEKEATLRSEKGDLIRYIDPKAQDLFTYVDMIHSCKYFIATFSGGASIAAAMGRPYTVIWPINAKNTSNYQFMYTSPYIHYTE